MNLMFQPQFEPMILSGRKPHTIRPKRKVPLRPGQLLSLRVWTGKPYRSKQREFAKAKVTKVVSFALGYFDAMKLDGQPLTVLSQNQFAYADGFDTADDMRLWFGVTHGTVNFTGIVIYFELIK